MFQFSYPLFEHKNILKKAMLDELRDYPLTLSKMLFEDYGNGVLEGCEISWDDHVLRVEPGLLLYGGNIYRMEEACSFACPPTDRLTYIKVRFVTVDYERDHMGGAGEISLSELLPENGEMELGRFRLQEGARLRCSYENFEDYQTEFDTVNRIHVPYCSAGGTGLWPGLLCDYAKELLESGTQDAFDIAFAMQILGAKGRIACGLTKYFVEKNAGINAGQLTNASLYGQLLHILKERRTGNGDWKRDKGNSRQMLLL